MKKTMTTYTGHPKHTLGVCFRGLIVGFLILIFSTRLNAQETVSGGWPPPETKQEVSRSVPFALAASGQNSVSIPPSLFDKKGSVNGNAVDQDPPFPIAIPVKITYPRKAIRKGWEGQAVIAAEILPNGAVGRMALAKSSGHEVLDSAATNAIKTWKFGSASNDEPAVPQYVDIPVTFKLKDQ